MIATANGVKGIIILIKLIPYDILDGNAYIPFISIKTEALIKGEDFPKTIPFLIQLFNISFHPVKILVYL